jgi:hypothetical protein
MAQARWQAATDGRYRIDVIIGNHSLPVMVDLGLVDSLGLIGFEVEPSIYDRLKRSGFLTLERTRQFRSASGLVYTALSGLTSAQLLDPAVGQPVGPIVQAYVSRGKQGLPNRVGLVFFHRLKRLSNTLGPGQPDLVHRVSMKKLRQA